MSAVAVVANIPGAKDAVQEPQGDPIWGMFAGRGTKIKQPPLDRSWSCLLPSLDDGLATTLRPDVMPKERGLNGVILALGIEETASVSLQSVVHCDRLVLQLRLSFQKHTGTG